MLAISELPLPDLYLFTYNRYIMYLILILRTFKFLHAEKTQVMKRIQIIIDTASF